MYTQLLMYLSQRPALYQKSTAAFWNDPHISKGMLKAHLDPYCEEATRGHAFVDRSAEWISRLLPPGEYPNLLDLGCGPGLYAQRYCGYGYRVTGIDLSERSIDYAMQSAREKGLSIRYRLGNYLELRDADAYEAATMIYCDYGVLSPEDRRTLLGNVCRALRGNGCFLLDVLMPRHYSDRQESTEIQYLEQGFWSDEPHAFISSFFRYDEQSTYANRYIVLTKSDLKCYHIWNHAFTAQTLRVELLEAGFATVEFFGNVAGDAYSKNGRVLCAVAKKRG